MIGWMVRKSGNALFLMQKNKKTENKRGKRAERRWADVMFAVREGRNAKAAGAAEKERANEKKKKRGGSAGREFARRAERAGKERKKRWTVCGL
jgi:hypothetical protein